MSAHLAWNYLVTQQVDKALEQCQKTLDKGDNYVAHHYLGQIYEQKQRYADAVVEFQKAITISGGATEALAALGHAYALSGQRNNAQKVLEEFDRLARQRYVSVGYKALIYIGLGEKELALQWLEKAYEERSGWLVNLLSVDPRFDTLRSDPHFQDLIRRLKLPT